MTDVADNVTELELELRSRTPGVAAVRIERFGERRIRRSRGVGGDSGFGCRGWGVA